MTGYIPGVLLIAVLLILQVFCDLRIPKYTADIIDIGIGQSGIESPLVPELSGTGMQHLLLLMTQEEQETALSGYVKDGELYRKQKLTAEEERALAEVMTAPMVAVYALSTDGADYEEVLGDLYVPRGMDVFGILGMLPDETRLELTEPARGQIREVPQELITQAAVNFVREDMRARGIDVDSLQRQYLLKKGFAMILAVVCAMLFAVMAAALASRISVGCAGRLRQELFERTLSSGETENGKYAVSELVSRTTGDVRQVQQMLSVFFRMVLYALLLGAGAVLGMVLLNREFGRLACVVLLLALLLTAGGVFFALPRYRALREQSDRIARMARENVQGMMTMRMFGAQEREKERLCRESRELMRQTVRAGRLTSMALPLLLLLMDVAVLLAAQRGAVGINEGSLLSGGLVAGIQYMMMEVNAFVTLAAFFADLPAGASAAARIEELLDDPRREKAGKPSAERSAEPDRSVLCPAPALEFCGVSCTYPEQSEPALQNVSFAVDYGEKVALVGGMGSGKTTLLAMASALLAPTAGETRIDGKAAAAFEPEERSGKIGYVPQEAFLFSGTVASNLRLGKPDAAQEELWSALRIAQAEKFVRESGKGLDMEIAPGGENLSGGQRQRLTIARALVGSRQIYLFDDCFSALDADTDARLQAALAQRTKGAAVLVADQQIRRIMDADRIVVLDGGRVVGMGRHEELMRNCEAYRQIALSQETAEKADGAEDRNESCPVGWRDRSEGRKNV